MKTFWMILAAVGGLLAVFFVFQEDFDKAFVAAAGGAVCWFLNYRQQIREKLPKEEDDQELEDEAPDEDLHS
ncbi:MAG TPA: hypothetical protein VJT69_05490 [Pyrinomonadaceae bacterium]|nr:hypothetical protein [Pyrinomonadaceae bacterium]